MFKVIFINTTVDKIKKICQSEKEVKMFIDMDGVICEFEFFTKDYIEAHKDGLFKDMRPLISVIAKLKELNEIPNITLYILSLAKYNYDIEEKQNWLEKYAPFIKKENIFILTRESGMFTKETSAEVKAKFLKSFVKDNEYIIFLEDTHENMFKAKDIFDNRITNFHVSSFIE